MPYITASIILQLLAVVIPRLETLRQEGQSGQAKITQYTRYLTIGLAILQSTGIIALARSGNLIHRLHSNLIPNSSVFTITTMVICMTAGTAVIMWLGELITDRGVGNGMSLMIFTQVIAVIPGEFEQIYEDKHAFVFGLVVLVGIAIIAFVALMEQAQRRIPVQYAKRMVGRRDVRRDVDLYPAEGQPGGRHPGHLRVLAAVHPAARGAAVRQERDLGLGPVGRGQPGPGDSAAYYMARFFMLIVFFTYFYVSITFNPTEVADNMKKYGGFIPGIRPGGPTAGLPAATCSAA